MQKQNLIAIIVLSLGMATFAFLYAVEKHKNTCKYFVDHMDTKCLSIMLYRLGGGENYEELRQGTRSFDPGP